MLQQPNGGILIPPRIIPSTMTFGGIINEGHPAQKYPRWMYKDGCSPLKVADETEEEKARKDGYDAVSAGMMANHVLINWFWDIEDMSPRQLCVFAHDEYGVDLPIEAGQDRLFKAVVELAKYAPQSRNRLVLMAHTMRMNYDETLDEIKRLISGNGQGMETETETYEIEV